MPAFIEAGHLDRLAPGKGAAVTTGNNTVALFKVDGVVYAIEAWCLRCGAPLAEGNLEGLTVVCRGCDWRFDVTTGAVAGVPALRLQTFDVKIVGDEIIVTSA